MTHISKYPLDKALEEEMFRQFWISLSRLQGAHVASSFFSDLLSESEKVMLAKRFTIAVLLLRGRKPVDISSTLHVSYSTIGSVWAWVKNAKPHTKQLFATITRSNNWQKIFDQIDALLDTLPFQYGTNWAEAGKARWQQKVERTSRQRLLK